MKKVETSNLPEVEFKTLVIRILKKLNEDLNSIKKIQSEMKDTLTEIKNNLQRNNSRVNKNQINDFECMAAKKKKSEQEEKRNKKIRIVLAASGTTSIGPTFAS